MDYIFYLVYQLIEEKPSYNQGLMITIKSGEVYTNLLQNLKINNIQKTVYNESSIFKLLHIDKTVFFIVWFNLL
ncbi:hypothetical protein EMIT036CA2_60133 [Chryseobacterium sp. IT-36CA2]